MDASFLALFFERGEENRGLKNIYVEEFLKADIVQEVLQIMY